LASNAVGVVGSVPVVDNVSYISVSPERILMVSQAGNTVGGVVNDLGLRQISSNGLLSAALNTVQSLPVVGTIAGNVRLYFIMRALTNDASRL
jgi:hypothetical protein